jgi:hypothetical protein
MVSGIYNQLKDFMAALDGVRYKMQKNGAFNG